MMFVSLGIGTTIAVALIVVVSLLTGGRSSSAPPSNALIGTEASTFTLPGLSGGSVTAPYAKGHPTALVFMASYCGPCRAELPHLISYLRAHPTSSVRVIGVDSGDQRAAARAFVRHDGVPFPVVYDLNSTVASSFQLLAIPDTVFIDAKGRVANVVIGKITPTQFAHDLAAIGG